MPFVEFNIDVRLGDDWPTRTAFKDIEDVFSWISTTQAFSCRFEFVLLDM